METKTTTKKNTKTKKVVEKKDDVKITHPLIKGTRITEKSAVNADKNIYTFNVAREANKNEIKKAIKTIYGVTPARVSVIQIKGKVVTRHGIKGRKQDGKKALVFLKKGDKITFA